MEAPVRDAAWRQDFPVALIVWAAVGIALNVGLHRITYGVMLPSLQRDLGLDYLTSGTLNAIHLGGYLAGTLVAPRLVRRFGVARLSVYAHSLVALGALVCAAAPASPGLGVLVLGLGRVATGLGAGAGILSVLVIALGAVSAARRPAVSAMVWSGMGAAIIASGLAVSVLTGPSIGWRAAFAVAAAVALGIAIAFPPKNAPQPEQAAPAAGTARFGAGMVLKPRWVFLVTSYLLFGTGYIAYATFAGARMAAADASDFVTGMMWIAFGAASIAGAAATVVVLHTPRLKPFALALSLGLAAVGCALAAFDAPAMALAGALLVGLGLASTPAVVSAQARERSSAEDYASAFSYATAALGIGQLAGPVAAGALADWLGTVAVPLFAASAYAFSALAAVIDMRAMRRVQAISAALPFRRTAD